MDKSSNTAKIRVWIESNGLSRLEIELEPGTEDFRFKVLAPTHAEEAEVLELHNLKGRLML